MCSVTAGIAVASMVIGGVKTISDSRTQASAMEAQADQLRTQAEVSKQRITALEASSQQQKRQISETKRFELGSGKTAFGARGINLGSEGVTGWELDMEQEAQRNRENVDYNTRIQQWQVGVERQSMLATASNLDSAAGKTRRAGTVFGLLQIGAGAGLGAAGAAGAFTPSTT